LQACLFAELPSRASLPPCERDARAPSTRDAGNAGVPPAIPTAREKTYPFEEPYGGGQFINSARAIGIIYLCPKTRRSQRQRRKHPQRAASTPTPNANYSDNSNSQRRTKLPWKATTTPCSNNSSQKSSTDTSKDAPTTSAARTCSSSTAANKPKASPTSWKAERDRAPYKGPDLLVVVGVDGTKRRKHWVVWDEDDRFPDLIVEITSPSTKCLCIIFSIPPRPTASSLQPPPHAAKPHPHNNDAASNHPSHDATPSPSSSNEDYNTVNNAHATHTPTNAPNTYESPANDETTHYPNTPPSAHPDALPPALTHPNTAPQPPSDTNPTPPQTLSDAPRPLASPNDLSHSHDPHAHPRAAHRAPCPPPSNYTPKATIT
jgi:hypothetical protein